MQATALGHRLETLHDGLTTFCDGKSVPVPLVATQIAVRVVSGLAFVKTTRSFRNAEANPIEAVMTFPVGFDAAVTGLAATIDGRRMIGMAKERAEARETYEAALDQGKLSVLHEEALRGVHILSVGALPPEAEVQVELEQTVPLSDIGGVPFLRLPMTAGHIYGTSPLLPSDDLVIADVRYVACLSVTVDAGRAMLNGQALAQDAPVEILMDRAVELRVEGGAFGQLRGKAADGSAVSLSLEPVGAGDVALDLHVIVDRSGSTNSPVREGTISVWQAMRDGLATELSAIREMDRITLWQFDSACERLGEGRGPACGKLPEKLDGPRGGTELAGAIRAAMAADARDILVLTDGQTWAHAVEDLKGEGLRISAILVGPQSLDANIGHLCALTGGQVFYAPGRDVASALHSAFASLRHIGAAVQGEVTKAGPKTVIALRGGVRLRAEWSANEQEISIDGDAIGRFAATLALPLLPTTQAEAFAYAHSLCTHLTSLVLVDDAGEAAEGFSRMRKVPMMASMSRGLISRMASHEPMRSVQSIVVPRAFSISPEAFFRLQPSTDKPMPARSPNVRIASDVAPSMWVGRPPKGLLVRMWNWIRADKLAAVLKPFADFSWDAHGDALLAGNFRVLSSEQVAAMERLAQRVQTACNVEQATNINFGDARILALGLIASRSKSRVAERFARSALRDAPPSLMALVAAAE